MHQAKRLTVGLITTLLVASICSACGASRKITQKDIVGNWHVSGTSAYQEIIFNEDGTFSTEGFLSSGVYEILENGEVSLIDSASQLSIITPEHNDKAWTLTLHGTYVDKILIPGKPNADAIRKQEEPDGYIEEYEASTMYISAVTQILEAEGWITSSGKELSLTDGTLSIGDINECHSLKITSAEGTDDGGYLFSGIAEELSSIRGKIDVLADEDYVPYLYKLHLKLGDTNEVEATLNGCVDLVQPE